MKKLPPASEHPIEAVDPTPRLPHASPPQQELEPTRSPWTTLLAAAAILCFIASQVVSQLQVQTSLGWQVRLLDKQCAEMESEIARLRSLEADGKNLQAQAEKVSETYQALLQDLLELSETDAEAQAIVTKFQIRTLAPL